MSQPRPVFPALPANPRFALLGVYGERSVGDEAFLATMVQAIRARWPKAEICAFSNEPDQTARRYGIRAVASTGFLRPKGFISLLRRGQLGKIFGALRWCDCLVLAGGELLRTDYGVFAVLSILDRVLLARLLGKPVVLLGIGVGRLDPGLSLRCIRLACKGLTILTREEESAVALREAGLAGVVVIPDLALHLSPQKHRVHLPPGPRIGFSFLDPSINASCRHLAISRETYLAGFAALVECSLDLGATPVLVPFALGPQGDDRIVHRDVLARMSRPKRVVMLEEETPAGEIMGLVADLDLMVGMRLHSLVFAAAQSVALMGIAYDPKVAKMMRRFGQEGCVLDLRELASAPELLRQVWAGRSSRAAVLRAIVERERLLFEEQFRRVFAPG